MGSIDFDSEPAYWYIKTLRESHKANLPTRSRPAVSRDEALQAAEVRRRVERQTLGYGRTQGDARRAANEAFVEAVAAAHTCAVCGSPFTRAQLRARRLWRVIYPPHGGRIELWRHSICPVRRGE